MLILTAVIEGVFVLEFRRTGYVVVAVLLDRTRSFVVLSIRLISVLTAFLLHNITTFISNKPMSLVLYLQFLSNHCTRSRNIYMNYEYNE